MEAATIAAYSLDMIPRLVHSYCNGAPPAQEPMEVRTPSNPARSDDSKAEMMDFERAWTGLYAGFGKKLLYHLYAEERTHTEAAELCGLSRDSATTYRDRAMRTLLAALNNKNHYKE